MKKILGIVLACLVVCLVAALVSTSVFATTAQNSAVLKNPFMRLWNAIHSLQGQLSSIKMISGPEGPAGPAGPAGECGCTAENSVSLADFQALAARVESLEGNNIPDCILESDCDDNDPCTDEACDALLGCVFTDNGLCTQPGDGSGTGGTGGATGDIIITEIMYNPAIVSDTYGEWLELYNTGDSAINLNGWSMKDQGTDHYTFSEDIIIMPEEYVLLCKNTDISINGGAACDAGYSSFTLGNTADSIILASPDATIIDQASYDVSVEPWKSLNNAGYSLQLDPASHSSASNDDGTNWCNALGSYGLGDYGTPGAINSDCSLS